MAEKLETQCNLVIVNNGERIIVGKAIVRRNGEIEGKVYKDKVQEIGHWFLHAPLEVFVAPVVPALLPEADPETPVQQYTRVSSVVTVDGTPI